jgi:hypothetical protein
LLAVVVAERTEAAAVERAVIEPLLEHRAAAHLPNRQFKSACLPITQSRLVLVELLARTTQVAVVLAATRFSLRLLLRAVAEVEGSRSREIAADQVAVMDQAQQQLAALEPQTKVLMAVLDMQPNLAPICARAVEAVERAVTA